MGDSSRQLLPLMASGHQHRCAGVEPVAVAELTVGAVTPAARLLCSGYAAICLVIAHYLGEGEIPPEWCGLEPGVVAAVTNRAVVVHAPAPDLAGRIEPAGRSPGVGELGELGGGDHLDRGRDWGASDSDSGLTVIVPSPAPRVACAGQATGVVEAGDHLYQGAIRNDADRGAGGLSLDRGGDGDRPAGGDRSDQPRRADAGDGGVAARPRHA